MTRTRTRAAGCVTGLATGLATGLVTGLVALTLACTGAANDGPERAPAPSARTAEPAESPEAEAAVAVVVAPPLEPPTPPPVDRLEIGWSSPPDAPSGIATDRNRTGLEHHREGRHVEALAAFDEAIEADASAMWARYNRACALARLGRDDEALDELDRVLREDLPRFGPKAKTDEDLASLREGPDGDALAALQEPIVAAYRDALDYAVPAWTFRPRDARSGDGHPQAPYWNLRQGLYDPYARRFIPLSPEVQRGLGTLLDRESETILVLAGQLDDRDAPIVQPRELGVSVFGTGLFGVAIAEVGRVDRRLAELADPRTAVSAALDGERVRLTYHDLGYEPSRLTVRVAGTRVQSLARTTDGPHQAEREEARHVDATRSHLLVDGHGVQVHQPPPPGMALVDGRLRVEALAEPVQLAPAHGEPAPTSHRVLRTPDGRFALVFTQRAGCGEHGSGYAISRVDLATGEASLLAQADGFGGAALAIDGTVFVDDGSAVVRHPPDGSPGQRDVPVSVRFALPGFGYACPR